MATLVLQAVGTVVGGALGGPAGALIGRGLGAVAGAYVDQQLFGPGDQTTIGPRLDGTQALSSREGAPIPKIYGRARVAGEIIWATNFLEVQNSETQSQGGKGGATENSVLTYSYFGNFAIALCEGEIGGIGRIWADGKLINNVEHTIRVYKGTRDQAYDSLIEAKQGAGNTPAYRGLAYVVFENFALEEFGNRIPQISVEVIRPIGLLEKHVHAVNMIPGSTEFGYDNQPVIEELSEVESRKLNVYQTVSDTDFLASLDELIAICPNLKQIALVVAWFGDDLRAGHCTVRPKVETSNRNITTGEDWYVAGLARSQADLVSTINGSPAYGGTPSDNTVVRAIQEIKSRGLKVCLNPFVMMDVPGDNNLPSPYGGTSQDAYPWRGRITCTPARGVYGSVDGSQHAADQVQQFAGNSNLSDVQIGLGAVTHTGTLEWSYRKMIHHYIRLGELAGGVDMFLIGSEMRGLTSLRGANDAFPFVDELIALAAETKTALGSECLVSYGADWTEYFGFQPADGSQNVYYNLDPLWAHSSIDAVAIDNYMPLSDWRDLGDPEGQGRSSTDPDMLYANIAGGEGFEWYYASAEDRNSGVRTPITDGLGKPWVYRFKDIESWWSNYHTDRRGGAELTVSSPWVPGSKPIIFSEFGCPAVHNGPAQPNVFHDPKSSESAFPYFSAGARDEQAQSAYIQANQRYWDYTHPGFDAANNPWSSAYDGFMLDYNRSQLWAWDARPYPSFPDYESVWSDAENWKKGHWLNGRLGNVRIADLLSELLEESNVADYDVSQVFGTVEGYVIADTTSARNAVEVLINLYRVSVFEDAGRLIFRSPGVDEFNSIDDQHLVWTGNSPLLENQREQETDLPATIKLSHLDASTSFQEAQSQVRRTNGASKRVQTFAAPLIAGSERMVPVLEEWLHGTLDRTRVCSVRCAARVYPPNRW